MFSSKTSKLIPIACIVALVVGVLFFLFMDISANNKVGEMTLSTIEAEYEAFYGHPMDEVLNKNETFKELMPELLNEKKKPYYIASVVLFIVLSVSTLLAFLGRKKNSRKLVLTASILYLFSLLGIPSAILCFIAHAKMKKQV